MSEEQCCENKCSHDFTKDTCGNVPLNKKRPTYRKKRLIVPQFCRPLATCHEGVSKKLWINLESRPQGRYVPSNEEELLKLKDTNC